MIFFLWSAMVEALVERSGLPYAVCSAWAHWGWKNHPKEGLELDAFGEQHSEPKCSAWVKMLNRQTVDTYYTAPDIEEFEEEGHE